MRIFKQLCLLASLLLTLAFTSTTANAQWSDTENFEQNLGIWNDGGGDAYRSTAQVGLNGAYCMRLRDNSGSASSIFTDNINLSSFSVVVVNFIYIAESMESGEDFFFEYSNDGGSTFEKIKTYTVGSEFQNGQMEHETLTITRNFASNSVFRIRCDASGNQDLVYVDDIQMTASNGGGAACSVTATTSNIQCYGNGTSTIDDDTFTVDVTVTGSNTSGRWIGGIDGQEKSGNIGQTVTFGPYRTNHGSTISGWFRDQSNSNCQMDITVTAPRGCSDADNDPDPIPTGCSGNITGISINNNGTLINNINGQTFCTTDFAARDISVRSTQTGAHESLRFTITRPDGTQTNNENVLPYDSKGFWATRAGTYRVVAQLYSEDNQRGELCDTYTATFTVRDCGPSVDCDNLNANIGDSCNDGNNNTENDVVNGNCQCVGTPILVACTPSIVVRNNGSCAISLFDWRTNGDVFIATIQPNNQRTVSFAEGTRLRAVDTGANFNNLAFDESYIVNANCNQTFTVNPTYCNQPAGCTGRITGFSINPQNAALFGLTGGAEFCSDQFAARDIRIRANVSGAHQSLRFTVRTPLGSWTTNENAETYDSKGFWATAAGTYTITAVLYSEDGQRGEECDTRTETFTIQDCAPVCNVRSGSLTGGPYNFVVDGTPDFVSGINLSGNSGSNQAWIVTDDRGNILGLPPMPGVVDFDAAGPGTCYIYSVSHETDFSGLRVGNNVSDLSGCFDLSNFVVVNRVAGPTVDCPNLDANVGDSCNDGNNNTENDRVNEDCQCAGTPIPVAVCGIITSISINNNGTFINNINGQTFCSTDFAARDISVRSIQSGAHESLRFTITRPDGTQTNNENVLPYDSKGFWATRAGTYRVVAQLYSEDNQRGELCDTYTATFTVRDCGPSVDCDNLNANIGDSCNDGNNNTENDVVNGNCQCVGTPILVACTPSIVVRNNGSCAISLFDWRTNGDVFIATIQPNNQRTVSFAEGTRLRAVDTGANFNNLAFDESYIVNANCNQTFTVNPTYCNQPVGCTGKITSFSINPQNAALIGNINGREFCTDQFAARDIRIRANVSGTHQSMRFTVTTPDGSWTTNENAETYDSKGFWATSPGTYTISAVLYSEDGQRGDQCDTRTETFTIIDCNGGNTGGGACDFQLVSYDGFEGGMDEWNDGGSDCARVEEDAAAAGRYCVRLRDNSGNASSMISDELNFGGVQQVKVEFTFFASSMENGEDFMLEYTTDGTNYKTVESWVSGTDFQNDRFDDVSITFDGDFTDWTKLRIRCDASGNKDLVFIDEVRVFACGGSYLTSGNTTNRTQTGTKAVETSEKVEVEVATEISVFPNPARDLLNIQGLNGQSYDVFNITGQRVIESSNQEVLDIMPLQNGTYILRTTEGQMIRFNKI